MRNYFFEQKQYEMKQANGKTKEKGRIEPSRYNIDKVGMCERMSETHTHRQMGAKC